MNSYLYFQIYHTFYGTNNKQTFERDIFWIEPVFTSKFRIVPIADNGESQFDFDILGQTSLDRYSANPNMEPKLSFQSIYTHIFKEHTFIINTFALFQVGKIISFPTIVIVHFLLIDICVQVENWNFQEYGNREKIIALIMAAGHFC